MNQLKPVVSLSISRGPDTVRVLEALIKHTNAMLRTYTDQVSTDVVDQVSRVLTQLSVRRPAASSRGTNV
jgi:hypothetical protein